MLQVLVALQERATKLDNHELDSLMVIVATFIKKPQESNVVVLRLEKTSHTLRQEQACFESMLYFHTVLCAKLHTTARAAYSASAELDHVRIQKSKADGLNSFEEKLLCGLQIKSLIGNAENKESHSFVERARKRFTIGNVSNHHFTWIQNIGFLRVVSVIALSFIQATITKTVGVGY